MAGPRIFLTGASGYVGGEVLHQMVHEPQLRDAVISCLIRTVEKADVVRRAYPSVRIVIGDLDDTQIIKDEASQSTIVLNLASTKHIRSSSAIAEGLGERVANSTDRAYWIQMSGATLVAAEEIQQNIFGEYSGRVWHGTKDSEALRSLIRNSKTRQVENLVLDSGTDQLRTALIPGPLIYGDGHGPVKQRSIQAPDMAKYILQQSHSFQINSGQNRWSTVHVADLGQLMTKLVSAAASGADCKDNELWNDNGIYLVETGVVNFKDLSDWIYDEAFKQNYVQGSSARKMLDAQGVDEVTPHGSVLLGTNAIFDFNGAQNIPGWRSQSPSLRETISTLVASEAASLRIGNSAA